MFAGLYAAAILVDEVYIILRIGHAHAPGLGSHPREGSYGKRGFRLSEAFHQADAREPFEFIINGGIEGLAGYGAVFQRTEVVFGKVFPNEEAEHGGWSTK